MFWKVSGITSASPVDSILDKEGFLLEELLNEDELIQECKSLNNRLIDYLKQPEVLQQVLSYLVITPEEEDAGRTFADVVEASRRAFSILPASDGGADDVPKTASSSEAAPPASSSSSSSSSSEDDPPADAVSAAFSPSSPPRAPPPRTPVSDPRRQFKYPFAACEVLCCEVDALLRALAGDDALLDALFSLVARDAAPDVMLAGYVSRVLGSLLARHGAEVQAYLARRPAALPCLVRHCGTTSVAEVLVRLAGADEHRGALPATLLDWLALETPFLDGLLRMLGPEDGAGGAAANAAAILAAVAQSPPSALTETLSGPDMLERLVDAALGGGEDKEREERAGDGSRDDARDAQDALLEPRPSGVRRVFAQASTTHALDVCVALLEPLPEPEPASHPRHLVPLPLARGAEPTPGARLRREAIACMARAAPRLVGLLSVEPELLRDGEEQEELLDSGGQVRESPSGPARPPSPASPCARPLALSSPSSSLSVSRSLLSSRSLAASRTLAPGLPPPTPAQDAARGSYGAMPRRVGATRLKVVELLAALARAGDAAAERAVVSSGAAAACQALWEAFPFHNVLHHHVSHLLCAFEEAGELVVDHLLLDRRLPDWLMNLNMQVLPQPDPWDPRGGQRPALRAGYAGHVTALCNRLQRARAERPCVDAALRRCERWPAFEREQLALRNALEDVEAWACGRPAHACGFGAEDPYAGLGAVSYSRDVYERYGVYDASLDEEEDEDEDGKGGGGEGWGGPHAPDESWDAPGAPAAGFRRASDTSSSDSSSEAGEHADMAPLGADEEEPLEDEDASLAAPAAALLDYQAAEQLVELKQRFAEAVHVSQTPRESPAGALAGAFDDGAQWVHALRLQQEAEAHERTRQGEE